MSPFVRRPSVRPTDRLAGRSVFLLALGLLTLTFRGSPDHPAGEVTFQSARALVTSASLALGDTPEAERLARLANRPEGAGLVRERADGSVVGSGEWGGALVAAPFYVVGRLVGELFPELEEEARAQGRSEVVAHTFVGWRNALLTAFTAQLIVLVCLRLGAKRLGAWLGGLTYVATTFAWPQARAWRDEVQLTFALFAALTLILRLRERFERLEEPRRRDLFLLGLALGAALLTKLASLPALLVLAGATEVVVWRGLRRLRTTRWQPKGQERLTPRAAAALVLSPFTVCVVVALVHDLRAGGRLFGPRGFEFVEQEPAAALAGLLLSPGRGLLVLAPALLLLPFGWRALIKGGEVLFLRTLVGLTAAVLLVPVLLEPWHGGWTYGPRHLLPLLPFLWVVVVRAGPWVEVRPWRRRASLALLLLGLFHQLPAAGVDTATYHELALGTRELHDREPADAAPHDLGALQWDFDYAAPWAHWRILRHRLAGDDEEFPVREVFFVDADATVSPLDPLDVGFRHLAVVDLQRRAPGAGWAIVAAALASLLAGAWLAARGLARGQT